MLGCSEDTGKRDAVDCRTLDVDRGRFDGHARRGMEIER